MWRELLNGSDLTRVDDSIATPDRSWVTNGTSQKPGLFILMVGLLKILQRRAAWRRISLIIPCYSLFRAGRKGEFSTKHL